MFSAVVDSMRVGVVAELPWLVFNGAATAWNLALPLLLAGRFADAGPGLEPVLAQLLARAPAQSQPSEKAQMPDKGRAPAPQLLPAATGLARDGELLCCLTAACANSLEHVYLLRLLQPPAPAGVSEVQPDCSA